MGNGIVNENELAFGIIFIEKKREKKKKKEVNYRLLQDLTGPVTGMHGYYKCWNILLLNWKTKAINHCC